jgi:hypothetical protein
MAEAPARGNCTQDRPVACRPGRLVRAAQEGDLPGHLGWHPLLAGQCKNCQTISMFTAAMLTQLTHRLRILTTMT